MSAKFTVLKQYYVLGGPMSLGMSEIILILLVVVILFGGKKIPELAKALGRAAYEFKKAKKTIESEVDELTEAAETKAIKPESSVISEQKKEEQK